MGQVQRQFSDESDHIRSVPQQKGDSLYSMPQPRRPAGEMGDLPEDILKAVEKAQAEGTE